MPGSGPFPVLVADERTQIEAFPDEHRRRVAVSLDGPTDEHRFGPMTLRWIHLQVLHEYAHHAGHADILRDRIGA